MTRKRAATFLIKLESAIGSGRFQLTSDGLAAYTLNNVPFALRESQWTSPN